MKKGLIIFFCSLLMYVANAQKKPLPSKEKALAEILKKYPNAMPVTEENTTVPEETARKHCESVAYYDNSTSCWGIYTICEHHFLFWDWTTYNDETVGCN